MEIVDKLFDTSCLLLAIDLAFIKYWDFAEKKKGIKTPTWAVNLSVSAFLILSVIFVVSFLLMVWI